MCIRFNGSLKSILHIGLVIVLSFSLMSLIACSVEDVVKDIVDVDFDADAELEPASLTVEKPAPAAALSRAAVFTNQGSVSIQQLLDQAEAAGQFEEDLDIVDIESITLNYVDAGYSASWTPDTVDSFICTLTIDGPLNPGGDALEIAQTIIDGSSSVLMPVTLSTEAISLINAYLANRSTVFDYIVSCPDDGLDTFSVEYSIAIGVTISGNI